MRDAVDILAGYAAGRLDPVDVVEEYLSQLDAAHKQLNVVITTLAESARAAALASRERWRSGTARTLDGVAVGIKDIIAVAGARLTGGSRLLEAWPAEHAHAVRALVDAGAFPLAKLTTFAFANGDPRNVDFGVTRNPADPCRLAGGSSSGSAAAVGSGAVPVALGTDTGGSIRLPAAYSGIVGHKPSFGRVSRHGVLPLAWTLDHIGPMGTSVRDARLMLSVMAGADHRDPATDLGSAFAASYAEPAGVRIGVPDTYFTDGLDAVTASAFEDALAVFGRAGADVRPVHIPDIALCEPVGRTIITVEAAVAHDSLRNRLAEYDDLLGARLAAADLIPATDYVRALQLRRELATAFAAVHERCDVLLTPTTPTVAPAIEDLLVDTPDGKVPWLNVAARNTFPFNVSGQPAVSVPARGAPAATPVGIQVSGPRLRDDLVLDVAEWYERIAG